MRRGRDVCVNSESRGRFVCARSSRPGTASVVSVRPHVDPATRAASGTFVVHEGAQGSFRSVAGRASDRASRSPVHERWARWYLHPRRPRSGRPAAAARRRSPARARRAPGPRPRRRDARDRRRVAADAPLAVRRGLTGPFTSADAWRARNMTREPKSRLKPALTAAPRGFVQAR